MPAANPQNVRPDLSEDLPGKQDHLKTETVSGSGSRRIYMRFFSDRKHFRTLCASVPPEYASAFHRNFFTKAFAAIFRPNRESHSIDLKLLRRPKVRDSCKKSLFKVSIKGSQFVNVQTYVRQKLSVPNRHEFQ